MRNAPSNRPDRYSQLDGRLQQVCQQFKVAWQSGEKPRIEEYLSNSRWQEKERSSVLEELIRLELLLRSQDGERPEESEYLERFSTEAEQIRKIFGQSETIDHLASDRILAIKCPKCQHAFKLRKSQLTETIRCSQCGAGFRLTQKGPKRSSQFWSPARPFPAPQATGIRLFRNSLES